MLAKQTLEDTYKEELTMTTFSDRLLDVVGHLSERLGSITVLVDGIVDRIAPKTTAQACSYHNCGLYCGSCCSNCGGDYRSWTYYVYGNCGSPSVCTDCTYC